MYMKEELLLAIFITLLKNQWAEDDRQKQLLLPLFSK